MWRYDLEAEAIPVFPHSTSLHSHLPSHSYARSSISGSGGRGRSPEILHSSNDCTHCNAYKVHVIYTSLQEDAALRDWAGASPGHVECILGGSSSDNDIPHELSQVRTNLRRVRQERDDAIALNARYRNEVASLTRQLREAKDRILAIEIAYEPWNADFLHNESQGDEFLGEEAEEESNLEDNLSQSNVSPEADFQMDELWMTEEYPIIQAATVSNENWNDLSDDFDLIQQFHMIVQEDETSLEDDSSSDARQEARIEMNSTLPVCCTDSSSDSPPPSTSSSPLSEIAGSHSDHLSSPTNSASSDGELRDTINLMASAHEEGNTTALAKVKELIVQAERTPRHRRTKAQKYILLNWRPSSSRRNSSSKSASTHPHPASPMHPLPSSSKEQEIFVDASALGIGFVFKTQWLAWTFKKTPKIPLGGDGHLVMSWAELLAVEVGVRALIAAGCRSLTITVRSDNTGVIDALKKKSWCQRHGIEEILQNILTLCRQYGIQLKPSWVSTKTNPADSPSRGVFPPWALVFKFAPELPERLSDLLELVVPTMAWRASHPFYQTIVSPSA